MNKKTFIYIGILLCLAAGIGFFLWYRGFFLTETDSERTIEKTARIEEPTTGPADQIETQIEETRESLEELSKLSPEEKREREEERNTLSQQKVSQDLSVPGITIVSKDGKKRLRNTAQGYSLELPDSLVLARSIKNDWLEWHDREFMCEGDPECDPVIRISVNESNLSRIDLEEWFKQEEKRAGGEIYSPREKFRLGQETAYRVTENIPAKFEGYYYYLARDKKIYYIRISRFDDELYHPYLETFKFE